MNCVFLKQYLRCYFLCVLWFNCLFAVCVRVCARLMLADIVKIKMEHYEMSKVRSQSAEEYLKAFFDAELKPIWPQGWIQTRLDPEIIL